jgi:patatin-like phospholipase/acyl hydrolase
VLQEELGDTKVREVDRIKLLIPFYDTVTRKTRFIKSYAGREADSMKFGDVPLWEAALCSSSAPTFFSAHELKAGDQIFSAIDGGVGANNPVACALADAAAEVGAMDKIRILSLGTGENTRPIAYDDAKEWGAVEWAVPIIDVLMDAALDVYEYIAKTLLPEGNSLRLQFALNSKEWGVERLNDDMDDASRDNLLDLKTAALAYLNKLEKDRVLEGFL